MKKLICITLIFFGSNVLFSQNNSILNVSTYQLENGFTLFLNEDTTANSVFGAVMVKAGSVNESPEATGMAHYLEHLLFKGTDQLGTSNYVKEKPLLDSITFLYEKMALEVDKIKILAIQKEINQLAVKSAEYGLPNEFDKLLKSIGGTNINAFTSTDMTFYHNEFPAHEIEKWLDLYAQRFNHPVFRSFQSELEVVYEEKNRAMDGLENRIFEELNKANFPNLPYGEWGVLGKIEHLKKPSLKKMQEFYDKNYVAKNMALVLSGNFKSEEVLPLIKEKFKNLSDKEAPVLKLPTLEPLKEGAVKKIRITPIKIELLGWQTVPYNHTDRAALDVCENILLNESETGLFNQLTDNNEMMFVFGSSDVYNKAGSFSLIAVPKPFIQSITNTDKKVEAVLNKVKAGNFSDDLFNSSKYELSTTFQKNMEQLGSRSVNIGMAFSQGISWEEYIAYPEKINKVTKEEVMQVAQKYFGKQRTKIISRTGFPKKNNLEKPPFKAVSRTQKDSSIYAKNFENIPSKPFTPKFLDFEKDVETTLLFKNQELTKVANPVNELFYLKIKFKTGTLTNNKLGVAIDLMNYSGAGKYSFPTLKQVFSTIGCSYYFSSDDNFITLELSGNEVNLKESLQLVNLLLKEPNVDKNSLKLLVKSIKIDRKQEQRDKNFLGRTLLNYARYSDNSPYLKRYTTSEIKKMSVTDLLNEYKNVVNNYQTKIYYVGNIPLQELKNTLEKEIDLSNNQQETNYQERKLTVVQKNKILFIDDKKAIQSQIYFYSSGKKNNLSDYYKAKAFNTYFGKGFSGLIMQEIREYRSLAYTAIANYQFNIQDQSQFAAYIACQADKTLDAITVLDSLIQEMPQKNERIPVLKKNLQLSTISNYPDFKNISTYIAYYQQQGYKKDPNIAAYQNYENLTMKDIVSFYEKSIKNKPYVITIYGDKSKINLNQLKPFGEVEILNLKDVVRF
tara:strand:- start:182 stop:3052 length:2871 start_codon:yes stop_codon:yes gene_type:complete